MMTYLGADVVLAYALRMRAARWIRGTESVCGGWRLSAERAKSSGKASHGGRLLCYRVYIQERLHLLSDVSKVSVRKMTKDEKLEFHSSLVHSENF